MDRQVQSGSDLKFKRIPSKRNQSDERGKQHIKQHNLAVQIKPPPTSRKSAQKPRNFDEKAHTSVEGGEVHVEDNTKRRARASPAVLHNLMKPVKETG